MRALIAILALVGFLLPSEGNAQAYVQMRLEHVNYLRFERANVIVTIENKSARPMVFASPKAGGNADLRLMVRARHGENVKRMNRRPLVSGVTIRPGQKREFIINILDFYDITGPGSYLAGADLVTSGRTFVSDRQMFDIVNGIPLKTVRAMAPGSSERVRTYSLRYWARGGTEHLFLCVDEEASRTSYGVFNLGGLIRVMAPMLSVAPGGTVKVLHQSGISRYTRSVFKSLPQGVQFVEQVHLQEDGRPYSLPPVRKPTPAADKGKAPAKR